MVMGFYGFSIISIILIISCVIGLNQQTILSLPILIFTAVILHNILGLLVGYWGSRAVKFSSKTAKTLSIETGMQNSGLGVALAMAHFSPLAALPGAIFSFWHNISGIILAKYWGQKATDNLENPEGM